MAQPKSGDDLLAEMRLFGVRDFSVLVDDSTDQPMIDALPTQGLEGYYTFTASAAGTRIGEQQVRLLPLLERSPENEAWVLATSSKAGYALNDFLKRTGQENRIVFTLGQDHVSPMYSYVDFFHNETVTIAYLTNTFERGYKIHLPIAVRFLLRSLDGDVVRAWQRIVAPNQTIAIDSRDMKLQRPFVGYLEVYADVRHLNGEITPFLHFNCDYISPDGIASIHQSGFKPWPAGSRFVRGIVPQDGNHELTISIFNKTQDDPIACRAELRFGRDGRRRAVVRDLAPLARNHMAFVNINELFADELSRGANAADVVITPDKPMHRPNFYVHPRRRPWSWTAVEHGAALGERILTADERRHIAEMGARPWICTFPILPQRFAIDTSVLYLQEGESALHDFTFEIFDPAGKLLHREETQCDFGQSIDISAWSKGRGLSLDGGLLMLSPRTQASRVPHSFSMLMGLRHRQNPHWSVTIVGGVMVNVPFELDRGWMWNHPMVPTVHTEQFGKAVVDDEFDTLVTVTNASAMLADDRPAVVEMDIYDADGNMAHLRRVIAPNSSAAWSVRELIAGTDLRPTGCYSIWVYCRDRFVVPLYILHRRADAAVAVQHFYYCRFNSLERDLPHNPQIAPMSDLLERKSDRPTVAAA